jgi:hypothetical protein
LLYDEAGEYSIVAVLVVLYQARAASEFQIPPAFHKGARFLKFFSASQQIVNVNSNS